MSHEARINDALKQLGEEFRLGMVAIEEYRARRRLLIESWGERDATTSPGSARRMAAGLRGRPAVVGMAAPKSRWNTSLVIGVCGALLVAAGGAYLALAPEPPVPAATQPVAVAAPLPPQIVAVKAAAESFLARNVWDAESIGAFLDAWRQLAPAERPRALDEPALRTLRHALAQNIDAELQLVAPDAPPEARARLAMLEDFARELGG